MENYVTGVILAGRGGVWGATVLREASVTSEADLDGVVRGAMDRVRESDPCDAASVTPADEASLERVRDAIERAKAHEREANAAYCLDRADQYPNDSAFWRCLADAAEGIAKGEGREIVRHGEFEELLARVRILARLPRTTPEPTYVSRAQKTNAPPWLDASEVLATLVFLEQYAHPAFAPALRIALQACQAVHTGG